MDGTTTSINSILKNLIKNFNTLLDCPVRYSGEYNGHKIHNFIEYIEYYKRIKCITDEQALQELQYLLLDQAHTWWLRRKSNLTTWSEALTSLENQYSKKRPAYIIYKEIFKHAYDDYNSKEDFVDDKCELLGELQQPELTEENKLEMIYSLLPNHIQTKIKFVNIVNLKDLKEQLKNLKCNIVSNKHPEDTNTAVSNIDAALNNSTDTSNEQQQFRIQETNAGVNQIETLNSNLETNDRDPLIKVRRPEDLMPQIKNENEQNTTQQEEFLSNDLQTIHNNNSLNSNENFQIDSDIMNQINNIIDETELNMDTLQHDQHIPAIVLDDSGPAIAFRLNNETTIQAERLVTNRPESKKKLTLAQKKGKIRCSYCRRFNHTSQTCLKKAKHMKLFPEKFASSKIRNNSNVSQIPANEPSVGTTKPNNGNDNNTATSTICEELSLSIHSPIINLPTTVVPITSSLQSPLFNNMPEKCMNSILSTKLIAPINGPASNKVTASKSRGTIPKCHQCGALGFYKSICPNCSPIYNNQYK